jgi:hypothetical protein
MTQESAPDRASERGLESYARPTSGAAVPVGAADDLDAALGAALTRHHTADGTLDDPLRAAVHAVTDAVRADGGDVIAVLRAVKARLAARGVPPGPLAEAVVRWCIARFYARPLQSVPTRRAPDPGHPTARPT